MTIAIGYLDASLMHDAGEVRDRHGRTIAERNQTLKDVYAALKADLFFHMGQKKLATTSAALNYHDSQIRRISAAKAEAKFRAHSYGIKLD